MSANIRQLVGRHTCTCSSGMGVTGVHHTVPRLDADEHAITWGAEPKEYTRTALERNTLQGKSRLASIIAGWPRQ